MDNININMINNFLIKAKEYIDSDEYYAVMQNIASFYKLNEDEEGMLIGRVNAFLIGKIKEEELLGELISELEITEAKAQNMQDRIKKDVIVPFNKKLADMLSSTPNVSTASSIQNPNDFSPSIETLRQAPRISENLLTKDHILSQIENPPRTVVKKYVIEHEPITDPNHLIDDTVDERPKLQDHYND